MNETPLSLSELKAVVERSKHPVYSIPNHIFICRNKYDIVRVSPKNHLVMIYGNSKTGLQHINERHNRYQEKPSWKKVKEGVRKIFVLDIASKFHSSTIPFEYLDIADEIYNDKNLKIDSNTRPTFCDVYEASVQLPNGELVPYRLILYKGTKVIHNFYPISNKFTKPIIINYSRGGLTFTIYTGNDTSELEVPYIDQHGVIRFKVVIRFIEAVQKEKWYIQKNSTHGDPLFTTFIGERPIPVTRVTEEFLMRFEFADLSDFERIMVQLDN